MLRDERRVLEVLRTLCLFFCTLLAAGTPFSSAQDQPEAGPEAAEKPQVSPVETKIQEVWAERRAALAAGQTELAEAKLREISELKEKNQIRELSPIALSLLLEGYAALDAGDQQKAEQRFNTARLFDPGCYQAYYALGTLARKKSNLSPAFAMERLKAYLLSFKKIWVIFFRVGNAAVILFSALLLTGTAFILVMFLKYQSLLRHEIDEYVKRQSVSRLTGVIPWLILFLPVALTFDYYWLVLYWAVVFFGYMKTTEKTFCILALLCFLLVTPALSMLKTWFSPYMDPYLRGANRFSTGLLTRTALDDIYASLADFELMAGQVEQKQGSEQKAVEFYDQSVQVAPLPPALNNLGCSLYKIARDLQAHGEPDKAIQTYTRVYDLWTQAVRVDPAFPLAYLNLSFFHSDRNEQAQATRYQTMAALAAVRKVLGRTPEGLEKLSNPEGGETAADVWNSLSAEDRSRMDQALKRLPAKLKGLLTGGRSPAENTEMWPYLDNTWNWWNPTVAPLEQGRPLGLQGLLPEIAGLEFLLGEHYQRMGRDREAAAHYERSARMVPLAPALSNLGAIHYKLGEIDLAFENWQKAKEADKTFPFSYYNLSIYYSEKFDFENSSKYLAEATKYGKGLIESGSSQGVQSYLIGDNDVWRGVKEELRREGAQAFRAGLFRSPFSKMALGALVAAVLLHALRRNKGYAARCKRCGKPFCRLCKGPGKEEDLCLQCAHASVKKDGLSPQMRASKAKDIKHYQRVQKITAGVLSLVSPGAEQTFEGKAVGGFLLMLVWYLCLAGYFFNGKLFVPTDSILPSVSGFWGWVLLALMGLIWVSTNIRSFFGRSTR
jgi:tetratricopeptide (TPR) repeat protein